MILINDIYKQRLTENLNFKLRYMTPFVNRYLTYRILSPYILDKNDYTLHELTVNFKYKYVMTFNSKGYPIRERLYGEKHVVTYDYNK
jgi:hypothetical protein